MGLQNGNIKVTDFPQLCKFDISKCLTVMSKYKYSQHPINMLEIGSFKNAILRYKTIAEFRVRLHSSKGTDQRYIVKDKTKLSCSFCELIIHALRDDLSLCNEFTCIKLGLKRIHNKLSVL